MPRPASPLSDLDTTLLCVERLEAARQQDAALADAELDAVLRHVPGKRAILKGRLGGRAAIFRLGLDAEDDTLAREWDEMCRAWPQMQTGALRIAEPFHFAPGHAILITEAVEGTALMQHIWTSAPENRAVHLRPAAEWLRAYTAGSETTTRPRAGAWLNRAETAAARQPHARLQRRERKILKELRRLLPDCERTEWRHAICHGDFHPNNLIWRDGRYTGVDLGGSASMPIYKDMARFLMHMGRRGLIPSGEARFGVDARGIDAFAAVFELSETERDIILPFMLGVEALIRVEHAGIKRGRIRRAAEMSDRLIEDLARI